MLIWKDGCLAIGGMLVGMMFSFLKKYRVPAIAALVMMLLELTVELSQPYLISKIIDEGIRQQDLSIVWLWGSVLVGSAVIAFMERLMQGRTSFVIAHRLNTIRQADRILVLKDGRLEEQGSHDELLTHKGFYSDLYYGQLRKQSS
jgi:ABC-type multidrug transport system fused ATPase/permease subunit